MKNVILIKQIRPSSPSGFNYYLNFGSQRLAWKEFKMMYYIQKSIFNKKINKFYKKQAKKQKRIFDTLEKHTGYSKLNYQEAFMLGRVGLLVEKIILSIIKIKASILLNVSALFVCTVAALVTNYYEKFRYQLPYLLTFMWGPEYGESCDNWDNFQLLQPKKYISSDWVKKRKYRIRVKMSTLQVIKKDIKEYFLALFKTLFITFNRFGIDCLILLQLLFYSEPFLFLALRFGLYVLLITNSLNIVWFFFALLLLFGRMVLLLPHRTYSQTKYAIAGLIYKMKYPNICLKPTLKNAYIIKLWVKCNYEIREDKYVTKKSPKLSFYFIPLALSLRLYALQEFTDKNYISYDIPNLQLTKTNQMTKTFCFILLYLLIFLVCFVKIKYKTFYYIQDTQNKIIVNGNERWEYSTNEQLINIKAFESEKFRTVLKQQTIHRNILSITKINEKEAFCIISTLGTHRAENELLFRLPIAYTIQDKNINLAQDTETRQFLRIGFSDIFLIADLKKLTLLEKPIFKKLFEEKNNIPISLMLEVCRNGKVENLRDYIYQLISIKGDLTYKNSDTDQKIILYTLFFFNNNLDEKNFAKNIEMSNRLINYLVSEKGKDNPLCSSNLKAQLKLLKNLREKAIIDLLKLKKENTIWDTRINYGINNEQSMKNIEWMKNFLNFSEEKKNKIAFSKSVGD